jgi:hypothetical protein
LQQAGRRFRHSRRLRLVDVEALRQRIHAPLAGIFVLQPANVVIEKPFPQCTVRDF